MSLDFGSLRLYVQVVEHPFVAIRLCDTDYPLSQTVFEIV
jgi:hypothetical protein